MEIFSFTAISIGFALLQTICHNRRKRLKDLLGKPTEYSIMVHGEINSFGSTAQTYVPFFPLLLFWSSTMYHSSPVSASKAEVNQSPAHTEPLLLIFGILCSTAYSCSPFLYYCCNTLYLKSSSFTSRII